MLELGQKAGGYTLCFIQKLRKIEKKAFLVNCPLYVMFSCVMYYIRVAKFFFYNMSVMGVIKRRV
jgi:hypothetical protein